MKKLDYVCLSEILFKNKIEEGVVDAIKNIGSTMVNAFTNAKQGIPAPRTTEEVLKVNSYNNAKQACELLSDIKDKLAEMGVRNMAPQQEIANAVGALKNMHPRIAQVFEKELTAQWKSGNAQNNFQK